VDWFGQGAQVRIHSNVWGHLEMAPPGEHRMRIAMTAMVALGAIALVTVAESTSARATDIDDYRWDHDRAADCRVIETRTTNRWGDDVTIRRRVCQ
jgi:hypothetical protein